MKHYLIIIICLIPSAAFAQSRIRDLSLPPDESLNQPDTPSYNNLQPLTNPNGNAAPDIPIDRNNPQQQATAHFIDGYCDPNFKPLIANMPGLAGMQDCLEQQKQQSCSTFHSLPADAKRAVSDAVDCRYQATNGDTQTAPDCGASDALRLQLLKKYWGNGDTAQALVFLPGDVLGTSGKCTGGTH
ncbi:MAG: hypothetical protein KGI29_02265 [Pseudomonadota bacterium]|nr:hypothetical protein [Pseudomonadota bacterium]MDE3037211.1 hypothetical protein [Pseudomonadota bacterium]